MTLLMNLFFMFKSWTKRGDGAHNPTPRISSIYVTLSISPNSLQELFHSCIWKLFTTVSKSKSSNDPRYAKALSKKCILHWVFLKQCFWLVFLTEDCQDPTIQMRVHWLFPSKAKDHSWFHYGIIDYFQCPYDVNTINNCVSIDRQVDYCCTFLNKSIWWHGYIPCTDSKSGKAIANVVVLHINKRWAHKRANTWYLNKKKKGRKGLSIKVISKQVKIEHQDLLLTHSPLHEWAWYGWLFSLEARAPRQYSCIGI